MKFFTTTSRATASAALRWLTLKLGQSGSFALPVLAGFFALTGFSAETNALAKLQNVHRIVFLGDSITYAGGYVDDVTAYYVTRFPEQHFEFINVGLSSETVSGLSEASEKNPRPDLHERLGRVLEKTKPDLVFICYGMNDGIYAPLDPARLTAFADGMKSVHSQIAATGAKIIHVTPPVFDPVQGRASTNAPFGFGHPYSEYNQTLDQFSEWLVAQRAAAWEVADLHSDMNRWLAAQRKTDPKFSFSKDGVHPDGAGHWAMAKPILLYLGAKDVENTESPAAMVAGNPHGKEILQLVHEQEQVLRDAWLNYCGFNRPGVKVGLPVPEAEAKAADLDKQIRELVKLDSTLNASDQNEDLAMQTLMGNSSPKQGDSVNLKLFIVSTNSLSQDQFVDSGKFPKLGWISQAPNLTILSLKDVTWGVHKDGAWAVQVFLNPQDAAGLKNLTGENIGKKVLIVVGHEQVSAPTIRSPIDNGFLIEGSDQTQLEPVKNDLANLIAKEN